MIKKLLLSMYKKRNYRLRERIISYFIRHEGGEFRSESLRELFSKHHQVSIGLYTHGGCFEQGRFDRYTTIGRYCSIARSARGFNRNHPMNFKSTHAFFFNSDLGYVEEDPNQYIPLEIGHDVWIGHSAVILPNVRSIGTGAVIGAGAVVNKDIPPYAVVVGNPARVVRFRFSKEKIEELLNSKWWETPVEELNIEDFCVGLEAEPIMSV